MKLSSSRLLSAAMLVSVACACGGTEPQAGGPCTGHVALQVGRGSRPSITWQPACGEGNVLVVSDSDPSFQEPLWGATSFGSTITPPVVYGTQPAGAQQVFQLSGTDSLTVGARYLVTVGPAVRGGIADTLVFTVQ